MNPWLEKWNDTKHIKSKENIFLTVDNYIEEPVKSILDIGCGYARESEHFFKKYGSELWLLDGDFSDSKDKKRQIKFGKAEDFSFYNKIEDLKNSWNERKIKYTFVNANNINIPLEKKFHLIYSGLSCGFHYPANTYKDLILRHSDKNTKIIFDIRHDSIQDDIEIVNIISKNKKHIKAEIKFR
jgi:SAM-dependent methyltransferase